MAEHIGVHGVSATTHRQTCELHDNDKTTMCSGMLKKGGTCTKKAVDNSVPGIIPTCRIHREQLMISGWCRALLPCGFKCGRLFEWKPHGFQLCPAHRDQLKTCYFLKIPQEMRLRVYQFLLPDKSIPARFGSSKNLRTDGERAHITILRVNRQIHDEATALLYSTRVFAIGLSGTNLSMCNKFFHTRSPENGNHTLLDYQMQLMLLEQQNKRRLLQARLGQAALNGASSLSQRSGIPNVQTPFRSPIHYENDSIDSVWLPPISDKYFNMIRSFLLEVVFPSVRGPLSQQSNYRAHPASNTDATIHKTVELRLYDYCDSLHRVIGRLQLIQRPIAHLQIIVKLNDNYLKREEALSAAQLLLRPFRRLHSVGTPKVLSLTMRAFPDRETELLIPSSTPSAAEVTVTDFLKCWSRDLSSAQSSCQSPEVFEAYWKLEKLVATIKEHCFDTEPTFEQFVDLLHSARIAREADDLAHFTEIWDRVVNIWFDYLSSQRDFQSKVARSIEDIYEMVGKGRYTHKRPGEDGGWLGMQL